MWTRRSIADAACSRMARIGRSKPAISTIVSSRDERVAGRVGVQRRQRAVVAGVHRLEHVERLGAADLADDDAVGPHAQRVAHQVADRDLALALDVRRAGSRAARRGAAASRSSAASSMVTMRSSSGIIDDSTLSSVVLPVPVPPLTRMFARPLHAGGEELADLAR